MKLEAKLNLIGLSDHNDLQLVVAYYKLSLYIKPLIPILPSMISIMTNPKLFSS